MEDLISRSAAVEMLREKARGYVVSMFATSEDCHLARSVALEAAAEIAAMPGVDAEPVRHGKWVYDPNANDWGIGGYVCSECRAKNNNLPCSEVVSPMAFMGSKFCGNCGARMDEGGF